MTSKPVVYAAAALVWVFCLHAALLAFGVFGGSVSLAEPLGWYFLGKAVFCTVSLLLARALLEEFRGWRRDAGREPPGVE
jgi:hypothetical protein